MTIPTLNEDERRKYMGESKAYKLLKLELQTLDHKLTHTVPGVINQISKYAQQTGNDNLELVVQINQTLVNNELTVLRANYKTRLEGLTKVIESSRPVIPGAEGICDACDSKSTFIIGYGIDSLSANNTQEATDVYKCALCYKTF